MTQPITFHASLADAILYSRSAVVADWKCPRLRYWQYEYAGRGISPASTSLELFLGITIHDGIAAIVHDVDIDAVCKAAGQQIREKLVDEHDEDSVYFGHEQTALIEGILRGFARHVWPRIKAEYPEVVLMEDEVTYEHDGLTFMAKPDLVVRDADGELTYFEWKSTSSVKEQWITSWDTAVQLHSTVRAIGKAIGQQPSKVVVVGLNKGYVSYGKQSSPFCYGYYRAGEPPFTREQWSYEWRKDLKKYPIWNRAGGVKRWVEEMPVEMLSQQFPTTPPIFINDALLDRFFEQRAIREMEIRHVRDAIADPSSTVDKAILMDGVFPQHFEQCNPGWGHTCTYKKLCHGNIEDPLKAGFQLRYSHHAMEQKALEAAAETGLDNPA